MSDGNNTEKIKFEEIPYGNNDDIGEKAEHNLGKVKTQFELAQLKGGVENESITFEDRLLLIEEIDAKIKGFEESVTEKDRQITELEQEINVIKTDVDLTRREKGKKIIRIRKRKIELYDEIKVIQEEIIFYSKKLRDNLALVKEKYKKDRTDYEEIRKETDRLNKKVNRIKKMMNN